MPWYFGLKLATEETCIFSVPFSFVLWVCLMDSPVLNEEESSSTPRIKIEIILKTKTVFLHESTNKNFHIIYDICIIQQNILVSN